MTMSLAHSPSPAVEPPQAATSLGYGAQPSAPAANESRCSPRSVRDDAFVRMAAAAAAAVVAVVWLDAIARIASLYG